MKQNYLFNRLFGKFTGGDAAPAPEPPVDGNVQPVAAAAPPAPTLLNTAEQQAMQRCVDLLTIMQADPASPRRLAEAMRNRDVAGFVEQLESWDKPQRLGGQVTIDFVKEKGLFVRREQSHDDDFASASTAEMLPVQMLNLLVECLHETVSAPPAGLSERTAASYASGSVRRLSRALAVRQHASGDWQERLTALARTILDQGAANPKFYEALVVTGQNRRDKEERIASDVLKMLPEIDRSEAEAHYSLAGRKLAGPTLAILAQGLRWQHGIEASEISQPVFPADQNTADMKLFKAYQNAHQPSMGAGWVHMSQPAREQAIIGNTLANYAQELGMGPRDYVIPTAGFINGTLSRLTGMGFVAPQGAYPVEYQQHVKQTVARFVDPAPASQAGLKLVRPG